MDSLRLWARDGEAVRQAIALGEIAHMDTPGHNSRYISSESSRLTVTESQVRPSGEVRRAIIVGRNRGVAPGMSVPWGDRAPKLHAGLMRGAPPGKRQSVSGKTRRRGCRALCGPANHTGSDTPQGRHDPRRRVTARHRPIRGSGFWASRLRHKNGSYVTSPNHTDSSCGETTPGKTCA